MNGSSSFPVIFFGSITPENNFLQKVREKCTATGTLLIFDEIQTCYGRLGTLFGFETYDVIPDILCIAKGMGGGMPIGAFVAPKYIMESYTENPIFPLKNTVADLNVDMIGRIGEGKEGNDNYVYLIGSDKLSTESKTTQLYSIITTSPFFG